MFQEPQYDIVVEADKARLFEVVSNLLSNAVKFTASGSITISAEKTQDGRVARVKVTDSGTGIHPDMKPKLFTRFASKSESGTGIGLYLSKSIIDAHGGTIWGDNNPDGSGATFGFEIPLDAGKIVVNSKQSIV